MSTTSLGMPGLPAPTEPTWKQAWDHASFGPEGFLRRHPPAFTRDRAALIRLVEAEDPGEVVLLGSAGMLAPDLARALPGIATRFDLPVGFGGLVLAVDWLSHVPAHVVAVDEAGFPHLVHVDPLTGRERLGARLNETRVPQSIGTWLADWWPLVDDGPGARAEVGTGRDAAWRDVVRSLDGGRAIAVESGHLAGQRPRLGSLRCVRGTGPVIPDGERELVADVALDAVAHATGGQVVVDGPLSRVVLDTR